jgi:hypothetical protein
MECSDGSGVPVLYIGRTVPKGSYLNVEWQKLKYRVLLTLISCLN